MFDSSKPTPLIPLVHSDLSAGGIEVFLKRDDLIDKEISGNKWRKLKYNLITAKSQGFDSIITFGGAYSNHIAATAAACGRFGFRSIGVIRGEELHAGSNTTLQKAQAHGMNFEFISREKYKHRTDASWLNDMAKKYGAFIIPEGGSNAAAIRGVAEIIEEINRAFDVIVCPVGTGGTLAGLSSALNKDQSAIGFSCLKGENFLEDAVQQLGATSSSFRIEHGYHFGGYAKFDGHLIEFINRFKSETGIPLDPIYTGKMMYGLFDQINNGKFDSKTRIICVHTGGLQGIPGFNCKHNDIIIT